jgi:hypothetical protein
MGDANFPSKFFVLIFVGLSWFTVSDPHKKNQDYYAGPYEIYNIFLIFHAPFVLCSRLKQRKFFLSHLPKDFLKMF